MPATSFEIQRCVRTGGSIPLTGSATIIIFGQ